MSSSSAIEDPPRPTTSVPGREASLSDLRAEVRRQGRAIRSSQQAFTIFAVLAFIIAVAMLLAVALKLQAHPTVRSVTVVQSAGGASPAGPTAAAPALPHRLSVTLREFKLQPTAKRAAAGKVRFTVSNRGRITHEFVVLHTKTRADALPVKGGRASEAGNVGETGDVVPGTTKSVQIKLPPGHYALICNLPGHYQAGQHADLTVR